MGGCGQNTLSEGGDQWHGWRMQRVQRLLLPCAMDAEVSPKASTSCLICGQLQLARLRDVLWDSELLARTEMVALVGTGAPGCCDGPASALRNLRATSRHSEGQSLTLRRIPVRSHIHLGSKVQRWREKALVVWTGPRWDLSQGLLLAAQPKVSRKQHCLENQAWGTTGNPQLKQKHPYPGLGPRQRSGHRDAGFWAIRGNHRALELAQLPWPM